jgi:hypothetical protein
VRLRHCSAVVGVLVGALLLPAAAQAAVYPGPHGPRDVRGSIEQEWLRIGGARSVVGAPVTSETPTPSRTGAFNHFERGSIYWSPGTGAHEVHGAIRGTWTATGWENGLLGFPTTDETRTPNGLGAYNHFQGGSIYWSPPTGAHEVHGVIEGFWAYFGWETGVLGFPTTDETRTPNGLGAYNHFEGGSIYWSQGTGAHEVHGAIRGAWTATGWEAGPLGFPTTSETRTPNGLGAYNHFQGGSIYWSPSTGAQVVTGWVRDKWASLGWEGGPLGFPTGPQRAGGVPGSTLQPFQHGVIYQGPDSAGVVQGPIAETWQAAGGDLSVFGPPQSDEYTDWGGRRTDFQNGSLMWTPALGVYTADRSYDGYLSATLPIAKLNEPMVVEVVTGTATSVVATVAGSTDPQTLVRPGQVGRRLLPLDFGNRQPSRQRTQFVVDQPAYDDWHVRLLPVSQVPSFDRALQAVGTGSDVWRYTGTAGTAHIVASAPGAAITVTAYDGATNPLGTLAGGTGALDVTAPLGANTYVFVQCDGPWSITVS